MSPSPKPSWLEEETKTTKGEVSRGKHAPGTTHPHRLIPPSPGTATETINIPVNTASGIAAGEEMNSDASKHPLGIQSRQRTFLGMLFSFDGRIERGLFTFTQILLIALFAVPVLLVQEETDLLLPLLVILFPLSWISLAMHARRWHDMGISGLMSIVTSFFLLVWLLVFVGFLRGGYLVFFFLIASFVPLFYLFFGRGSSGPNKYG